MTQEFQEHWLSAYLDDELSAEERALVERRLQQDPAARELLEDLRRVRGMVATLPQWSSNFQFDPSGLEIEPLEPTSSRDNPSPNGLVNDPTTKISQATRGLPGNQRGRGDGNGAWRAILAMAASLILVAIGGLYWWQQNSPNQMISMGSLAGSGGGSASDSAGPGSGGPGTGGPGNGGGSELAELAVPLPKAENAAAPSPRSYEMGIQSAEAGLSQADSAQADNLPADSLPADSLAMSNLPAAARGFDVESFGATADAPAAQPMDPAASLGQLKLAPPELVDGLARAAAGLEGPGPQDQNLYHDARGAAPMAMAAPMAAAEMNATAASEGGGPGTLNSLEPAMFFCAHSNAWADAEVRQALTAVESFLPATIQQSLAQPVATESADKRSLSRSTGQLGTDNTAAFGKQLKETAEAESSPIITCVVDEVPAGTWFAQVQAVQPLTPVILPQATGEAKVRFGYQSGQETDLSREQASAERQAESGPTDRPSAPASIVLFVTQAEADKILASVQKPKPEEPPRYWRFVPTDKRANPESAPNDKVILILSEPPK